MVTYMIEKNNEIVGYTFTLGEAKKYLLENVGDTITKLCGPYKYEGFHHYYMTLKNGKFIKNKTYNYIKNFR